MSFSDLYTPGFKSRNRDHFAAIVRIALADGSYFIGRRSVYQSHRDQFRN